MSPIELLSLVATAVALGIIAFAVVRTWLRARAPHVVVCPETHQPAGVAIDVGQAVRGAALGATALRLADCSRWPERAGCGQECLAQMDDDPDRCLLRNVASRWYEGKHCSYCGHAFGPIHWHDHRPALRSETGEIVQWTEVKPDELVFLMATHRPVCWDCAVAETFRRRHPELVADRPRPPLPPRDEHSPYY